MTFWTTRISLLTAVVGIGVVALGAQPGQRGQQTQPGQPGQAPGPKSVELWTSPTTSLNDAGSTPRQQLRFDAKPGDTQEAVLAMNLAIEQHLDGNPMPSPTIPTVKAVFRTTVESVDKDNQTITYAFEYDNVDVEQSPDLPPGAIEQMRQQLQGLEDISGQLMIDHRGVIRDGQYDLPAGTSPTAEQLLQSFEVALSQISSPLPKEKIGVNAKWQADLKMDRNDLDVSQTTTYALKKLQGDMIHTTLSIKQNAKEQDFSPPGMPPGVTMHLNSLEGAGEGTMQRRPGALLPEIMDVSVKQTMDFSADMGGQKRNVKRILTTTVSLQPNEPKQGKDADDSSNEQTGN